MSWNLGLQVNNLIAEVNKLTAVSLTNPVSNNIGLSNNGLTNCSTIGSSNEIPLTLDANNTPPTITLNNSSTINGSIITNNTANADGLIAIGNNEATFVDTNGSLGINYPGPPPYVIDPGIPAFNYPDVVSYGGATINGNIITPAFVVNSATGGNLISRAQAGSNTYVKMDPDARTQLCATNSTPTTADLTINGDLFCTSFQGTLNPPLPSPYKGYTLVFSGQGNAQNFQLFNSTQIPVQPTTTYTVIVEYTYSNISLIPPPLPTYPVFPVTQLARLNQDGSKIVAFVVSQPYLAQLQQQGFRGDSPRESITFSTTTDPNAQFIQISFNPTYFNINITMDVYLFSP